jgi:hypothetical protein
MRREKDKNKMRSNFLSNKSFRALEGVKKLIGTL